MTEEAPEERGPRIPADPLHIGIEYLTRVQKGIGFSAASNDSVVAALGHTMLSGSAKRKLAVLNHYGLLERVGRSSYKVSELGKAILHPRGDREYRGAIGAAARRPRIYQELWNRYKGQPIPSILPNLLVREFGVLPKTGHVVAQNFVETMGFAGLLQNGVLTEVEDEAVEPETVSSAAVGGDSETRRGPSSTSVPGGGGQRYIVALDARGRIATVDLPVPVRQKDLTTLENWLSFMRTIAEVEATELDGS